MQQHGFEHIGLQQEIVKSVTDEPVVSAFDTSAELLAFVTERWQKHFVTIISSQADLQCYLARPFFLLISVDAPIHVRWQRHHRKIGTLTLESFVSLHDKEMYDTEHAIAALVAQARIKLLNASASLSTLYESLDELNLLDDARLRPTWDHYFMTLASLAARRSNCMRRQVGCVVIRQKRVISTGYNGTPRNVTNCNNGGCARCNKGSAGGAELSTCRCVHAEENALLEAGRERIGGEATLYCTT